MIRIARFHGPYEFLSNFFRTEVVYAGVRYKSSEHAYQASKADNASQHDFIAAAATPGMAKKRGQCCSIRADWDAIKITVMEAILRAKFENPALRGLLLGTGNAELIEGNVWDDVFWGACKGVGENWLGRLLMKIREEFRLIDEARRVMPSGVMDEDITVLSDAELFALLASVG